jgi:hypothetical protein
MIITPNLIWVRLLWGDQFDVVLQGVARIIVTILAPSALRMISARP